jgi:hypothetical protein
MQDSLASQGSGASVRGRWPGRGWLGLALVAVFWTLDWSLDGLRTHWAFFPLWVGYSLAVDAWAFKRTGSSLWFRDPRRYVGLYLVSAPVWWLFELINWRTANWSYLGRAEFSDLEYAVLASVSFSTVIPAVFGTAELVGSFFVTRRSAATFAFDRRLRAILVGVGFLMLVSLLAWPRYFFPFVWTALFLIVDPINDGAGARSLLREVSGGRWHRAITLALGCLVCGFFWEMWNYYSYPKWTYDIPFVGFFKIFEMPLLGYGGYVPFALKLFALYHSVEAVVHDPRGRGSYIRC